MRLAPRVALLAAAIGIPLGTAGMVYALTDETPEPGTPAEVRIGGPREPGVGPGPVQPRLIEPSPIQPLGPPPPRPDPRPAEVVVPPPPVADDDDDTGDFDDDLDDDDGFDDDDD